MFTEIEIDRKHMFHDKFGGTHWILVDYYQFINKLIL